MAWRLLGVYIPWSAPTAIPMRSRRSSTGKRGPNHNPCESYGTVGAHPADQAARTGPGALLLEEACGDRRPARPATNRRAGVVGTSQSVGGDVGVARGRCCGWPKTPPPPGMVRFAVGRDADPVPIGDDVHGPRRHELEQAAGQVHAVAGLRSNAGDDGRQPPLLRWAQGLPRSHTVGSLGDRVLQRGHLAGRHQHHHMRVHQLGCGRAGGLPTKYISSDADLLSLQLRWRLSVHRTWGPADPMIAPSRTPATSRRGLPLRRMICAAMNSSPGRLLSSRSCSTDSGGLGGAGPRSPPSVFPFGLRSACLVAGSFAVWGFRSWRAPNKCMRCDALSSRRRLMRALDRGRRSLVKADILVANPQGCQDWVSGRAMPGCPLSCDRCTRRH